MSYCTEYHQHYLWARLAFCNAFCPFNVDGAACVRVFDPLEILYPDLVVLLAPPGTKLLAYSIVYSVVEALCCVAAKHLFP